MRYKLRTKRSIDYIKADGWLPKIYSYDTNGILINIYYGERYMCYDTFVYYENGLLMSHFQTNIYGDEYGYYRYIYNGSKCIGVVNRYNIFIEYTYDSDGLLIHSFKTNNSGTNIRSYIYNDVNEIIESVNNVNVSDNRLFYYKDLNYLEYK